MLQVAVVLVADEFHEIRVQDQMDFYSNCQDTGQSFFGVDQGGGWRYDCNSGSDNSVNQWGVIGMIAAENEFGKTVPAGVKTANQGWLGFSQDVGSGVFGYDSSSAIWGPYATTPSGMVQLVWNKIGRGNPKWDLAETFMRNNFGNAGSSSNNVKAYYYGMFSFSKSMILHNPGTGSAPITLLQSSTPGVNPIDWYAAERNLANPEDVQLVIRSGHRLDAQ